MRLFLLLFPSLLAAADPLPREIVPEKAVLELQPDQGGGKVWNTRYFRLESELDLRPNDLLRLAQVADTTALSVKSHPLPLFAPPKGQRATIAIHATDASYGAAGGAPGTAGFYLARQGRVIVHGAFFTRSPDAARSKLAPQNDEDIVVHELVHLCMHQVNHGLPQWLVEGTAEYFASAHTGAGRFSFGDMDGAIRQHLRVRLSPDDPGIPLVPVADVIGLGNRGWLEYVTSLPVDERYRAYATSLLLAHHQLHGGEKRLATLRESLAAAPRVRRPVEILPVASAAATQEALVRYWRPKGLTLEFPAKTR